MATLKPFRGWRYAPQFTEQIGKLISPPFDVVSAKQRAILYQEPYNSIHLSVPKPEHSVQFAAETWNDWQESEVVVQDTLPSIYVYYQCFQLPGVAKPYCRKGFIMMIKAAYWEEKIVLRHEDTIPGSVNDRVELLEATQLNASPTHGLYTDPNHRLEAFMDQSMLNPIYQAEDYQGVRDIISVITDPNVIHKFVLTLHDKQIILADGHHRYESSLIYRRNRSHKNTTHSGEEGYNYHLMYLTNTESEDLVILPTHRLIRNLSVQSTEAILQRASQYFIIKPIESPADTPEIIAGKKWAFGLLIGEESYKLRLKPELFESMDWGLHSDVKSLETVVLHYFFIEKVLGIIREQQARSPHISYERNFANCYHQVVQQEAQMALITNGVSIEEA